MSWHVYRVYRFYSVVHLELVKYLWLFSASSLVQNFFTVFSSLRLTYFRPLLLTKLKYLRQDTAQKSIKINARHRVSCGFFTSTHTRRDSRQDVAVSLPLAALNVVHSIFSDTHVIIRLQSCTCYTGFVFLALQMLRTQNPWTEDCSALMEIFSTAKCDTAL